MALETEFQNFNSKTNANSSISGTFKSYKSAVNSIDFSKIESNSDIENFKNSLVLSRVNNEQYLTERVPLELIRPLINEFREIIIDKNIYVLDIDKIEYASADNYNFENHTFNSKPNTSFYDTESSNARFNIGVCSQDFASNRKMKGEIEVTNAILYSEVRTYTKMLQKKWYGWVYIDASFISTFGNIFYSYGGYTSSNNAVNVSCSDCSKVTDLIAYSAVVGMCAGGLTDNEVTFNGTLQCTIDIPVCIN